MSFQQGLSGLNGAAKNLDVIGNNVANSTTVGFKSSAAQFADVFAASLSGAGGTQIGIGTKIGTVTQQFTQGNITVSNNPLDVAVNGKGFFRMSNGGAISFTRNGQFQMDKDGYIVNASGLRVTGYMADSAGVISTAAPTDITINSSDLTPQATANMVAGLNLDARATAPTGAFNTAVANNGTDTYTSSTSANIYDSLGNPHAFTMYFVRGAAPNTWTLYANVDGTLPSHVTLGAAGNNEPLVFNSSGALTTPATGNVAVSIDLAGVVGASNGATTPLTFTIDFGDTTQFGSPYGVNNLTQDGFTSGRLSGFNVGADGIIKGRYTNGQSVNLAQIALVNFNNPQGLQPLGNNQWTDTPASGAPVVGTPNTSSLGVLQSAAVEDSNVDLTAELVNMITAQRIYQANAQTIKTQDQVLQTLVNLR